MSKKKNRGRMARAKGIRGELEIVHLARELGFPDATRGSPMQSAGGERLPDVCTIGRLWVENKTRAFVSVKPLARQILGKERPGFISVLTYRENRQRHSFAVLLTSELIKLEREGMNHRAEITRLRDELEAARAVILPARSETRSGKWPEPRTTPRQTGADLTSAEIWGTDEP